mmetsp:Transcript_65218/g.168352  ORF Transcript_65218/g.168352 Transcript_65218/m.168352 type:complete len:455 (+) Transcript_65218:152-1516(+)
MGTTCGTSSKCCCGAAQTSHDSSPRNQEDVTALPTFYQTEAEEFVLPSIGGKDGDCSWRPGTTTWQSTLCGCSQLKASSSVHEINCKSDGSGSTREASCGNMSEVLTPSTCDNSNPGSARSGIPSVLVCLGPDGQSIAQALLAKPGVQEGDDVFTSCPSLSKLEPLIFHDRSTDSCGAESSPGGKKSNCRLLNIGSRIGLSYDSSPGKRIVSPVRGGELRPTSGNVNRPQDYMWLQATLDTLVSNEGGSLGCTDLTTNKGSWPIFVVIGGCPNIFCGMQAVMFTVSRDGEVDFWWVKPESGRGEGGGIERQTLNRHGKGPHKNDPGRSKPFYKPLADLFSGQEKSSKDGTSFGIERVNDSSGNVTAMRAYIEQEVNGRPERYYLSVVWQEDWTTNPFARSKYIKGKIVYQKTPEAPEFFSRQYNISNGQLTLSEREDPPFLCVIPGDDIKDLRD